MTPRPFHHAALAVAVFGLVFAPRGAVAQSEGQDCPIGAVVAADRLTLRCPAGLVITLESGATLTLIDGDGNGAPDSAELLGKAVLIESPEGGKGFEVVTPQAIAAVRGTRWAVDVQNGKTSVFVARGRVDVRRPTQDAGVTLGPGEGVDVADSAAALEVRRWPTARVAALLARLGQ